MTARDRVFASIMGLRTQGIPEWTDRANRELDAYRDEVRLEVIEHLRNMTWDGRPSPWFHMAANKLQAELLDTVEMPEQLQRHRLLGKLWRGTS